MSNAMLTAFRKIRLKPGQKLVAMVLADRHNSRTGQCNISMSQVAEETGLTKRSVIRIMQSLEGKCWTAHKNFGTENWYELHPPTGDKPSSANGCHNATRVNSSRVTLETPTGDIRDIDLYKESKESTCMNKNEDNLTSREIPKKTNRPSAKKHQDSPPPDPRHYDITSRIKATYEDATGDRFVFDARFTKVLQRFLASGWDGTADEWLARYREAVALGGHQYAKHCVDAADPCYFCQNYMKISAEIERLSNKNTQPKPIFTKGI